MAGDWREATLAEVARITSGKRPSMVLKTPSEACAVPVIGGGGPSGFTDAALFEAGVLITGRVGTLGKLFVASEPCWPSDNALVIQPSDDSTDSDYLRYALQAVISEAAGMNRGAANPLITQGDLGRLPIGLPPLPEQRAVGRILRVLDDKIEVNRRMGATLEAMARALFKSWFVDFEPVRAKAEGRDVGLPPHLVALFPDRLVETEHGEVPEGWRIAPVSDFAQLKGGKQLEKQRFVEGGPVPVFGGAGLMGHTDEHNAEGYVISVGRVGAYCGQFFAHRGRAWINNNASLISQFDGVPGEWLLLSLRNLDMDLIKKGAAQPFVSNSDLAAMPIVAPAGQVLKAFHGLAETLFRREELVRSEAEALAALRDTLLPQLISGDLRVKDAETFLDRML